MERIQLFGEEFLLEDDGTIYDDHDCYAVINEEGEIMRYLCAIGKKEDIVYLDR